MSQPTAGEVVALLEVNPSTLPLAPGDISTSDRAVEPCVRCGSAGALMLIAITAIGNRWVDLCNPCFRWATARR